MATPRRRRHASLAEELFATPHRFSFFQAVRLLERAAEDRASDAGVTPSSEVGVDSAPNNEVVRFLALAESRFPSSEIHDLEAPAPTPDGESSESGLAPARMSISFLGLTGPSGALPDHYTTTIVRRSRVHEDGLADFLDLFNHRIASLFYRTWEKYRIPVRFERQARRKRGSDLTDALFHCLVGMGTKGLHGRMEIPDRALVFYAGLFAQRTRNAVSLEALLCAYFDLPVRVCQFQGEWHRLDFEERSHLPSPAEPLGRHNLLGRDTILGGHVWDVQGQFRLRVGPLPYKLFRAFMPTGSMLPPFSDLVRAYVGPQLGFSVQPVLDRNEAPPCLLGAYGDDPPLLGWNTWIHAEPIAEPFDGVRFSRDDATIKS